MVSSSEPYLRAATPVGRAPVLCPPGWAAEPVGRWDGRWQEVVYNPRRHDVLVVRGGRSPTLEAALPASGWNESCHTDGARMWVRDRLGATRDALARLEERPRVARELGRSF